MGQGRLLCSGGSGLPQEIAASVLVVVDVSLFVLLTLLALLMLNVGGDVGGEKLKWLSTSQD